MSLLSTPREDRSRGLREVTGIENGIDFDGRYKVEGHGGVAFYLLGWATMAEDGEPYEVDGFDEDGEYVIEYEVEPELVDNPSMVRAVMVGDDAVWLIDVEDLTPIEDEDYCGGCGQIGCGWS